TQQERRNSCAAPCGKYPRYFSLFCFLCPCFLRRSRGLLARELQEDFFKTHCRGPQFIEVPACFNDGAGQVSAHEFFLGALHLEYGATLLFFLERHSADARDLLKPAF